MTQQTVSPKRKPVKLFDRLEELTSGEIFTYHKRVKDIFERDLNKSYSICLGGDCSIAHIFNDDNTHGFVFIEGGLANFFSLKILYAEAGASVTREYSFRDKQEAGFMWQGRELSTEVSGQ